MYEIISCTLLLLKVKVSRQRDNGNVFWLKLNFLSVVWKDFNREEKSLLLYITLYTGKNDGFPFLDILGYLKNTHKNPKFGKVRQVPTREFPTKFPNWDLSHSSKFGIFVGIL